MNEPVLSEDKPAELRLRYHRRLDEINGKMIQLFALVGEGLAAATHAMLSGDRDSARALVERDNLIDSLYRDIETLVQQELALQAPMAELAGGRTSLPVAMDMALVARFYERLGDHAVNICQRIGYLAGRDS